MQMNFILLFHLFYRKDLFGLNKNMVNIKDKKIQIKHNLIAYPYFRFVFGRYLEEIKTFYGVY